MKKRSHAAARKSRTVWSENRPVVGGALEPTIRANVIEPPKMEACWMASRNFSRRNALLCCGGGGGAAWVGSVGAVLAVILKVGR